MTIMVHAGGRFAEIEEVENIPLPQSTSTWEPMAHKEVINIVKEQIPSYGFDILDWKHALRRDGNQYFGLVSVRGPAELETPGISLQVGIRNSIDKSLAAAMVAGNKVFVCDNLAFCGEVALSRKHTTNIRTDIRDKVSTAFTKLLDLFCRQKNDIELFKNQGLCDDDKDKLILQALRSKVLPPSKFDKLEKQWDSSAPDACGGVQDPTVWRWFNAVTQVIKDSHPDVITKRTGTLFNMCRRYCALSLPA